MNIRMVLVIFVGSLGLLTATLVYLLDEIAHRTIVSNVERVGITWADYVSSRLTNLE